MYESYYGLKEKPFAMLPDPAFLYLSKKHQMALTLLEYGLLNQAGFCVVSGETGSGKTTLLRKLLENVESDVTVGMITNTHKGFGELLDWVLSAYGIHDKELSQVDKHQRFIDFLIEQYANNRSTLLIVDEAQNMTAEKLEELRMLSNVNSDKDQVLQVILAGQPALKDTLRLPEMMQFAQRIAVDYHLGALDRHDTQGYINHRLKVAGAEKQIFTQEACHRVHDYCGGIPRLVNLLCDTVMVYGFADQEKIIDEDLVDEMVSERMVDSIVPLASVPPPIDTIREKRKARKETLGEVYGETLKEAANDEGSNVNEAEIEAAVGEDSTENRLLQSYEKSIKDKPVAAKPVAARHRESSKAEGQPESAVTTNASKQHKDKTPVESLNEVEELDYADAVESIEHMVAEADVFAKAEKVLRDTGVSDTDVELRGRNIIEVVEPPEIADGNGWKWISAATLIIVAVVLVLLMRGGIKGFSLDSEENALSAGVDAVLNDGAIESAIPDKIKRQLVEAERLREELAERQREDRLRMEELERQARQLQKERDEVMAKAAAEKIKRDAEIEMARMLAKKEREAQALVEKARKEALVIEQKNALIQEAMREAETAKREKELSLQKAMLEEIEKQKELENVRLARELAEQQNRVTEKVTKTDKQASSKEQKFSTDPCSSSTARFLSTCR